MIYQSVQQLPAAAHRGWKQSQALIGKLETVCMLRIPLVAEFNTDHVEKATFMISASIFSVKVWEMELKFGEEIEQNRIDQQPSPVRRDFSGLVLIF